MKHTFVLDANIVMRVLIGHEKARDLWRAILTNCHKVAVSQPLFAQYLDMWRLGKKRLPESNIAVDTPKLVWELLAHQQKASWPTVEYADPKHTKVRHQRDWFLPGLVAASGGRLVTTDPNTRRDLGGLTVEQALKLASEKNGG